MIIEWVRSGLRPTRGGVPKWLRERSAKPPCIGSNPIAASNILLLLSSSVTQAVGHQLGDHHRAEMSVGADYLGHHGAVDNSQSVDSEYATIGIDHRARVGRGAHPAGACGVLRVEAVCTHPVVECVAVGRLFDHPLHH